MKRILVTIAVLFLASTSWGAKQDIANVTVAGGDTNAIVRGKINTELAKAKSNFDELYANKADVSCFASESAFNACFDLTWADGGIITDAKHVDRINQYVAEMIQGYGGAESMLDIIEFDKGMVGKHVVMGYFTAKDAIGAAETIEDVSRVDLPGDPGIVAT